MYIYILNEIRYDVSKQFSQSLTSLFVAVKVHVFAVNDCVRISDNIHQVKEMQKSHGEWTENMKTVSYWLLIAAFYALIFIEGKYVKMIEFLHLKTAKEMKSR